MKTMPLMTRTKKIRQLRKTAGHPTPPASADESCPVIRADEVFLGTGFGAGLRVVCVTPPRRHTPTSLFARG